MTVTETPIMSLCHVVRHACLGMEDSLRKAEDENKKGNANASLSKTLEIYYWASKIEMAVKAYCMGGGKMANDELRDLKVRLKRNESLRRTMYFDSEGIPTIGWGHNLYQPISEKACEVIFTDDLGDAIKGFFSLPINVRSHLSLARREVLVEMIFQLGIERFLRFEKMLKALSIKDYGKAADEILDSKAVKVQKLGNRFGPYADVMRMGGNEKVRQEKSEIQEV